MTPFDIPWFAVPPAVAALCAMVMVARIDCRRFEIDPLWLAILALSGTGAVLLAEGARAFPGSLVCAALAGSVTALVRYLRPGRIGQGDIGLLAVMGLIAGPDLLPLVLAVFVIFVLLTSAAWSRARGKRLFRSMIPAALPAMAALAPVFLWRILWPPQGRVADLLSAETLTLAALVVSLAPGLFMAGVWTGWRACQRRITR